MNWYVLYVFSNKTNKILSNLNQRKELTAFIPKTEVFHRQAKKKTTKDMFDNYIFVKSDLKQNDFNDLLLSMNVLDKDNVARVSVGYQEEGKTIITEGPLLHYQDYIVRVMKHHCTAQLDLPFFDRKIILGVELISKN